MVCEVVRKREILYHTPTMGCKLPFFICSHCPRSFQYLYIIVLVTCRLNRFDKSVQDCQYIVLITRSKSSWEKKDSKTRKPVVAQRSRSWSCSFLCLLVLPSYQKSLTQPHWTTTTTTIKPSFSLVKLIYK